MNEVVRTKRSTGAADKRRAQMMRIAALMNVAAQPRFQVRKDEIGALLNDRRVFEDASLVALLKNIEVSRSG